MKKAIFKNIALFALFGGVFFTSCVNHNKANYEALIDKQWNLTELIHKDSSSAVTVPAGVNIIFADSGRVYGNAGCNNINGMYEVAGQDQIGLSRIATTQMFCFNMEFETGYLQLLDKVVSFEADSDRLELQGAGNDFRLVYTNGGAARYNTLGNFGQ